MIQILMLISCITLFYHPASASPVMAMAPGGTLKPMGNHNVRLLSEEINITLYPDYYLAEINYTFNNKGESQTVTMGFPASSRQYGKIQDLNVFNERNILPTYTIEEKWDFQINQPYVGAEYVGEPIDRFECVDIPFNQGETKKLRNTFRQQYTFNNTSTRASLFFIMKTGSLWNDNIQKVDITINTMYIPAAFDLSSGYFNDEKTSLSGFHKTYTDIEPDNDLILAFDIRKTFSRPKASSELKSQGNVYAAPKAEDGNTTTAWVEGATGPGVGETITFYTTGIEKTPPVYALKSIGIVNGYALDKDTYLSHSRVKQILVTIRNTNEQDPDFGKSVVKAFMLRDSQYIQYFDFNPPVRATEVEFKINSTYGVRTVGTAISEIEFVVDEN